MSKRAGVLGEDSTGFTPARSLSLTTDLYKNTVVCLFLVICALVGKRLRGCRWPWAQCIEIHKLNYLVSMVHFQC